MYKIRTLYSENDMMTKSDFFPINTVVHALCIYSNLRKNNNQMSKLYCFLNSALLNLEIG